MKKNNVETNKAGSSPVRINTLPHAGKLKGVMLWYLTRGMLASKLPWKKTAWTGAGFPIELLWAYDVFPLHPENMATVAAARRQSQRLIEHAEGHGLLPRPLFLLQDELRRRGYEYQDDYGGY